ncbi:MAG: ATP-binding protein, partial [Vampirovibrionales bacterium]
MPTPDDAYTPLNEAPPTDTIRVFSQAMLERLEAGNFVPVRQHQHRQQARGDRRSKETPLALCKRSIRYEPLVFEDRPEVILRLAKQLNRPSLKCLALYGEQGLGKTSIVRGLAELMGGGDEQLLWFELADYQQLEALCVQLLQQVVFFIANHTRTHVAWDEIDWRCQDANNRKRLLTWVEQYLNHIPNLPLLLVIDNADVLFGQTQLQQQGQPTNRATTQIISPALLHILQWWVRQPNTKLVLLSHDHLPEVLALPPQAVCHEVLRPFSPECLTAWEQALLGTLQPQRSSNTTEGLTPHHEAGIQRYLACFKQLHHASDGLPWIVQGLRSIHQHYLSTLKTALFHPEPEVSESQLNTHPLIIIHELYQQQKQTLQHPPNTLHVASHLLLQALMLYWQQVLPAEQKTLMFALLGFIQHSVPSLMLMDMLVNTSHREAIDWLRQLVSHACIRPFVSVLNEPQTLQQTFIQPLLQGGHRLEKNTLATDPNEGICLQFDLPQRLKQVLAQHLT